MPEQMQSAPMPGKPAGREPEIHVMPSKYAGSAVRASIPKAPPMSQVQATVPAAAKPLPQGVVAAGKAEGPAKGLIIGGIALVLVVGGILAALFWPRGEKPAVTPPTNVPAAVEMPEAPPVVEEPIATATPEEATSTPEIAVVAEPRNALDSDSDGLSDIEEQEIYRTDAANPDSDSDGYLDGGEVFYLYNPSGIAPVTLRDSGLVYSYESPDGTYSLLVPLRWRETDLIDGVEFLGATGEGVSVKVESNPGTSPLIDWYLKVHPEVSRSDVIEFVNRTGIAGVKSPDGLTAYLAAGDKVYVLNYELSGGNEISYRRTFEMMANGFRLAETAAGVVVPETVTTAPTSTPEAAAPTGPVSDGGEATSTVPEAQTGVSTTTASQATSTGSGTESATGTPSANL